MCRKGGGVSSPSDTVVQAGSPRQILMENNTISKRKTQLVLSAIENPKPQHMKTCLDKAADKIINKIIWMYNRGEEMSKIILETQVGFDAIEAVLKRERIL